MTSRVHAYEHRVVADVPVDARRVVVVVAVRRLKCMFTDCARQTFRKQLPGVPERYQRRTPRLTGQIGAVARELAGRAGRRALAALAVEVPGTPLCASASTRERWAQPRRRLPCPGSRP